MKHRQRYFSLLIWLTLTSLSAADFTASAPGKVVLGQQFQLVYTFTDENPSDFRISEQVEQSFDILMGPSTSRSSSISIVNGKRTSSSEYRYTFLLLPKKEGSFSIPPATAKIKKKEVSSNALTITVLPADKAASGQSSASSQSTSAQAQTLTEENLFLRVIPTKTRLYEQEAVTLTYKLYTRLEVAGAENYKFPEYKGFMMQEIESPQEVSWDMENYNGRNYRTAVLRQVVLFPQQSGTLEIDPCSIDLVVRIRTAGQRSRSFFDDFFDTYQDVRKTLTTKTLRLTVEPYPFPKPANFNPLTGSLKLSSQISATQVKADEGVTVKLTLSGSGNMKMLRTPELKFPADFDVYDPQVSNQFKTTAQGVSGTKTIEYLVIPRYAGTFEIPSACLSYFDLATKSYKTLCTEAFTLQVDRSENAGEAVVSGNYTAGRESVRQLGQDIRYLKTVPAVLQPKPVYVVAAVWYKWAFVLPLLLVVVLLLLYRKQLRANADAVRVRNRKANKVAVRRLKKASSYLKDRQRGAFYDEVLKALWGYTSDKLNIPLSDLTKDNIDVKLASAGVEESVRRDFMDILTSCEFERYAPGQGSQTMEDVYAQTLKTIDRMENTIKTSHV
ncbi:MAG: protein BatD [Bacteroidales bacterium]|nr:protein BatD [Bacteroidales bacterium]